jgi:hypothetical protein
MRLASLLAIGTLFAGLSLGLGAKPAEAAPAFAPAGLGGPSAVEPARLTPRAISRRGGRKVMGLPTPGTRGHARRTRLPRL